jgi:hypothetical protein
MANALTYYNAATIKDIKSFMLQESISYIFTSSGHALIVLDNDGSEYLWQTL